MNPLINFSRKHLLKHDYYPVRVIGRYAANPLKLLSFHGTPALRDASGVIYRASPNGGSLRIGKRFEAFNRGDWANFDACHLLALLSRYIRVGKEARHERPS